MATLFKHPKSGIFYARHVYRENGKRREKRETLNTRDETTARRRLSKWATVNVANRWGDTGVTFDAAATKFIRQHCASLKPSTVERYEVCLRQLRPFFGTKMMREIKPADLLAFEQRRRKDRGRASTKTVDVPVSVSSIRKDLLCLSSIMSYAVLEEWCDFNPVPAYLKKRKASGLRDGEPRRRYLTEAEEGRLLAALQIPAHGVWRREDQMRYAAVIVDLDAGLRVEERMSLEWRDVQLGSKPHVFIRETKSGKARRVPLMDRVAKVVSDLPIHPTSPFVFCKESGERYGSFRNGILAAARRAGIEDFTEHDLRRTCGTRLLQKHKRQMAEVSRWLGHSSIKVTEKHYAFLREEDLDEVVEADRSARASAPSAEILKLRRG